jgi:hypothetical protein
MAFFLSCSDELKPIERETWEEYQRTLSASGAAANPSCAKKFSSQKKNTPLLKYQFYNFQLIFPPPPPPPQKVCQFNRFNKKISFFQKKNVDVVRKGVLHPYATTNPAPNKEYSL